MFCGGGDLRFMMYELESKDFCPQPPVEVSWSSHASIGLDQRAGEINAEVIESFLRGGQNFRAREGEREREREREACYPLVTRKADLGSEVANEEYLLPAGPQSTNTTAIRISIVTKQRVQIS